MPNVNMNQEVAGPAAAAFGSVAFPPVKTLRVAHQSTMCIIPVIFWPRRAGARNPPFKKAQTLRHTHRTLRHTHRVCAKTLRRQDTEEAQTLCLPRNLAVWRTQLHTHQTISVRERRGKVNSCQLLLLT